VAYTVANPDNAGPCSASSAIARSKNSDELNGHAQTILRFANAALDQCPDAELPGDLANISAGNRRGENEGAEDHFTKPEPCTTW
jgi:hypothetical protein